MNQHCFWVGLLLLVVLLVAPRNGVAQDPTDIAPAAREYLEHALRIMESEALKKAEVDWVQIRAEAYRAAAGAQHPRETYLAISSALWALGDNHSRFRPPLGELPAELQIVAARVQPEPEGRRLTDRVGYVSIPGFSGEGATAFARQILDLLLAADGPEVCGWVVDVRGNTGGNMWPMLEGLSPVLGDGVPGYFVAADDSWTPWHITTDEVESQSLARDQIAVALLQGPETASSGEAVVVAFRGRSETRTFGQRTEGLSTANRTIELADGAHLILTVAVYADRNRNIYGAAIEPDELIPVDTAEEAVLESAVDWLLTQPACVGG
jgi:carboxyl-terminal processing protease